MLAVTFTTLDVWLVVLIVVLILVSGLLALAETAITRTSRAKAQSLVDQGVTGAERLRDVVDNLERDLNSLFLVLLVAQTVQASLTGVVAVRVFGGWGVAIATVVNIVVVFVVAEAAPKTWALQHTERAALFSAPIVAFVGSRLPARGPTPHRPHQRDPAGQGPEAGAVRHRGGGPRRRRRGGRGRRHRPVRARAHRVDHRVRRHRGPRDHGARGPR